MDAYINDYEDDTVGSYCPPRTPPLANPLGSYYPLADQADQADQVAATPRAVSDDIPASDADVSDRPDTNVKACKDIRVIFAHDLSGSMNGSRKMIADGTNEFIQDLTARYAAPCDFTAKFCLITFSGDNVNVGEWTDIHNVQVFGVDSFVCSGTTPLWDTCVIGLDKMERECEGCTAALYCFTDGDDNNSKKSTRKNVRARISTLDQSLHTMLFIGSDPLSSAANADAIGVVRTKSLNPSSDSTPSAMRACTNAIARCVTGETQTPEFNDNDINMSEGPLVDQVDRAGSGQSYDMVDYDDFHDVSVCKTPSIGRTPNTPSIRRQPGGGISVHNR
jgi:Mg-chelatase subunit ChlD